MELNGARTKPSGVLQSKALLLGALFPTAYSNGASSPPMSGTSLVDVDVDDPAT